MRSTTHRAREVAAVLVGHGFGSLADLLDLRRLLPAGHESSASTSGPGPVHLRRALEDLGPTFMKLGQVLSTRPDLVAPRYEFELSLLQDSAPRVSTRKVVLAIETAFGRPMTALFDRFDDVPLAAASIGQVHAARLPDGSDVVVKVRRPHVVEQVMIDLELLNRLAAVAARRSSIAQRYDPVGLAHEFGTTLLAELDYQREGRNADRISAGFANHEHVDVPKVFWDFTCVNVITEARVRGIKIDDLQALDAAGLDRSEIAQHFADAYLSMVFVHRFFHADPHPGNIFVGDDGRIGFVDFGMVGSVGARAGGSLGEILLALVGTDPARMVDGLLGLGVACEDVDRVAFEGDLARFLERYSHLPLEQLHVRFLLADLMSVVRARRLRLPSEIALLLKTVMMCEGVAAQLDPKFELVPMLIPYATRLAFETRDAPESA